MSGGSSSNRNECRIYVGNLPPDIRTKDIQDLFYKFGKVTFVDLKNRKGPPFAFVEFEDPRDADDAVRARDGYDYDGYRLRVEFPRGGGGGGRGARGGGERWGGRAPARGPPARRSEYRVLVTGLPPSGSWQDLKDHMREAGDVCFADTFKDGSGVVEFLRHEDMKYAVKKLDDSRFRSHEVPLVLPAAARLAHLLARAPLLLALALPLPRPRLLSVGRRSGAAGGGASGGPGRGPGAGGPGRGPGPAPHLDCKQLDEYRAVYLKEFSFVSSTVDWDRGIAWLEVCGRIGSGSG